MKKKNLFTYLCKIQSNYALFHIIYFFHSQCKILNGFKRHWENNYNEYIKSTKQNMLTKCSHARSTRVINIKQRHMKEQAKRGKVQWKHMLQVAVLCSRVCPWSCGYHFYHLSLQFLQKMRIPQKPMHWLLKIVGYLCDGELEA
jgi:hypothetical protein